MAHNTEEFDQTVKRLMDEWKVPGLSIAIVKGEQIDAKAYGFAKLDKEPCTTETIFDLASTTKTTTAAAVACLVDDERFPEVQWTTPVSKLIPDDFVLSDPQLTEQVTVEDILSHRTGYPGHEDSYFSRRAKSPDDARSITRNLRNLPAVKPLRTHWIYSNIMFTAATHLVESLSKQDYTDFLHERLWKPLGMTNTFHDHPDIERNSAQARRATGYSWNEEKQEYIAIVSGPEPEGQGAGCIWSSAGDYAKWIRALMNEHPPLSKDAYKELVRPRMIVPDPDSIPLYSDLLYALGIQRESYRGHTIISHDGGVDGFRSKVGYLPQQDWGIVMLGNAENAFYLEQAIFHILMDELLGVPKAERTDWEKFFHGWQEEAEAEDKKNEEDPEFQKPENPLPLGHPLEVLSGMYFNKGYKGLVIEAKDGVLIADCTDRCYPFMLTFEHLTGLQFVVRQEWVRTGAKKNLKGEFRLAEDGSVLAVGVKLEEDLEDFVWFDKKISGSN